MPQNLSEQNSGAEENDSGGQSDSEANKKEAAIVSIAESIKSIAEREKGEKKKKPWYKKFIWVEAIGVLILVVQTGIFIKQCSISKDQGVIDSAQAVQSESLFAYTKRQDISRRRDDSISDLKDSIRTQIAVNQSRPVVIVDSIIPTGLVRRQVGNKLSFVTRFVNSGSSLAKNINVEETIIVWCAPIGCPIGVKKRQDIFRDHTRQPLLSAGQSFGFQISTRPLAISEIETLGNGRIILYAYVVIRFLDYGGYPDSTKICLKYNAGSERFDYCDTEDEYKKGPKSPVK